MPSRVLTVLFVSASLSVLASTAACIGRDGGCYEIQTDIVVTPSASCLTFTPDVCDAVADDILVTNDCTDPLTIGSAGIDAGSAQTVIPGQTLDVQAGAFTSDGGNTFTIPAQLGATSIVITFRTKSTD